MSMEEWVTPQNILSIVLILVTVAYTVTSILTWSESRKTRKQKNEPNVIVYIRSNASHDTLYVCVKNIGEGCATHVRIIPTIDYTLFGKDTNLKDYSLFSDGINVFPPQFEMTFPLDTWSDIKQKENPLVKFEAHYSDLQEKNEKIQVFTLPFKQMATIFSDPPATVEERIPYYLNKIQKELKQINQK